jgi:hypothetical protein
VLDAAGGQESIADDLWERAWVRHHYRMALDEVRRVCEPKTLAAFEQLVAGESVKRVAATFQMSEDAVRRVQQRMRDRLRDVIAKQIQREDGSEVDDES